MSSDADRPTKDPTYYFHDGSCVFQAENVLFKVQRSLLARDSAVFQDLFSLPVPIDASDQAEGFKSRVRISSADNEETEKNPDWEAESESWLSPVGEGERIERQSDKDDLEEILEPRAMAIFEGEGTEEHPVILQDSADEFRALCWVLYARPSDILAQQNNKTTDLARLVRLIFISHKYEFDQLLEWSWDIVEERYIQVEKLLTSACETWEGVARLLNLAYLCSRLKVSQCLETDWLSQIRNASNATKSRRILEQALNAAEQSPHLRSFHGKAYYAYLQAIKVFNIESPVKINDRTSFIHRFFPEFREPRKTRLREGYWSLVQFRSRLYVPPQLNDLPNCDHYHHSCVSGWENWWIEKLARMKPIQPDPGLLISSLVESSTNTSYSNSPQFPSTGCREEIRAALKGMKSEFDESLADHFMLPAD